MSHIETASAQIRELDAFALAVSRFAGARFHENCKQFISYTGVNRCDHAVTVDGLNYGIGLQKAQDGAYNLAFDAFGHNKGGHDGGLLTELFGNRLVGLTDAYSAEYVQAEARKNGYTCTETVAEDGALIVTATAY